MALHSYPETGNTHTPDAGPGGPPGAPSPNSSVLNPGDMAMAGQQGGIDPNMTVGQWLGMMGIRPEDPIGDALQKMEAQAQNATGVGKAQSAAGPPPVGPTGPPPGPPPGGLDSLMG